MEIYRVDSEKTGELIFAGAWQDAYEDWKAQLLLLRKGLHPAKRLQEHFDKFGEEDLKMSSVKQVNTEEQLNKEFGKLLPKEEIIEAAFIEPTTEKAVVKKTRKKK